MAPAGVLPSLLGGSVNLQQLAVAIVVPLLGGIVGSLATASQVRGWYTTLRKPSWTPPSWLFGPVWTVLYTAMGLASYLVFQQGGWQRQAVPLATYGLQLVLNFAWTPTFFSLHQLGWASADILAMWCAIVATIIQFRRVIGGAAVLLLGPYLLWVSYASTLTLWIWRHNPAAASKVASKVA